MTALSDDLLIAAVLLYAVAMLSHAGAYALADRRATPVRQLVPAAAGSPGAPVPAPPRTSPLLSTAATSATWLAWLAHAGTVASRALAAHRLPWGNMYEFVLTVTFVAATAWLVVSHRRPDLHRLGLFVALLQLLLLGVAGVVLYTRVSPLVPALQSYWFVIHVSAAVAASGIFLTAAVPTALFLIGDGHDRGRTRFPYTLGSRLPPAAALERLAFAMHAFAFPIWTFAVAAGAVWAEAAWGRYWGWDPKEIWAFVSWAIYAAYLHARGTPSVSRRTTAWLALLGTASMLMNLFGVNIFFTGLHSYGGLN